MRIPLKLYYPLDTLKALGDNIWIVDGKPISMNMKLASVPFSTRMTIIRLSDKRLWVHSPIEPSPVLLEEIERIGQVAYLVAPNKLHYAYIEAWKELFPQAQVWLAPGVFERANFQTLRQEDCHLLRDQVPEDWQEDLCQHVFLGSHYIQEVVFFHKTSRTLILTDFIENIEIAHMPLEHQCLYKLGDNAYPNGKTPRDLRLTFMGNKAEARKSLALLKSWQPDNIILAHGRCQFGDAMSFLNQAFSWLD